MSKIISQFEQIFDHPPWQWSNISDSFGNQTVCSWVKRAGWWLLTPANTYLHVGSLAEFTLTRSFTLKRKLLHGKTRLVLLDLDGTAPFEGKSALEEFLNLGAKATKTLSPQHTFCRQNRPVFCAVDVVIDKPSAKLMRYFWLQIKGNCFGCKSRPQIQLCHHQTFKIGSNQCFSEGKGLSAKHE